MVPLIFLRKRSSRFGATCWGITTHQANRADGLCKYCKGLPHPSACASLWVVIPQHVAPNLELLFPNYFSGTYGISVQFFFDWPSFSNGVRRHNECTQYIPTAWLNFSCTSFNWWHIQVMVWEIKKVRSAHTKFYLHRWLHYFLQLLQIAPIHLSPPLKVHMLAYFLQTLRCNFSFTLLHDLDKLFGKAPMDGSPKGSRTGVQKCNTSSILKKMVQL